jgi:hypothetical protein
MSGMPIHFCDIGSVTVRGYYIESIDEHAIHQGH